MAGRPETGRCKVKIDPLLPVSAGEADVRQVVVDALSGVGVGLEDGGVSYPGVELAGLQLDDALGLLVGGFCLSV